MKKSLVLMLTILLAASLFAGCGQGGGTTSDAILYYACGSEPYLTLDPSVENSNGVCVLQNVYETLTRYNDQTARWSPASLLPGHTVMTARCGTSPCVRT